MVGKIRSQDKTINPFEHMNKVISRWQNQGDDDILFIDHMRASRPAGYGGRHILTFAFASLFTLSVAAPDLDCRALPKDGLLLGAAGASTEIGLASWYGRPYHGRRAASGETYNMYKFTAAHRTLPFGTRVRVHNLKNARTVDVRVNDRGPFIDGRVIDLSRAAAGVLGMRNAGLARVQLEILPMMTSMRSAGKTTEPVHRTSLE